MKFKKVYTSTSINIYECETTKMKIEYLKEEKYYILLDSNNMIIWEFNTLAEAKQGAKDYIYSLCETEKIFNI